ncbi:B- and T-lymphocyte attenuator isoform X1, partial [Clarias magur]
RVRYPRDPIRRSERQSLTLKCTAEYEEDACGNVWVSWCLTVPAKQCETLTDPDRYVIHINETINIGRRQQDAFITFNQLTLNDSGIYQCEAKCQRSKTSAMGHVINVTVT